MCLQCVLQMLLPLLASTVHVCVLCLAFLSWHTVYSVWQCVREKGREEETTGFRELHALKPNKSVHTQTNLCTHTQTWMMAASLAAIILTLQKEETVAAEPGPNKTPPLVSFCVRLSLIHSDTQTADYRLKGVSVFLYRVLTVHSHMQHSGHCKYIDTILQTCCTA